MTIDFSTRLMSTNSVSSFSCAKTKPEMATTCSRIAGKNIRRRTSEESLIGGDARRRPGFRETLQNQARRVLRNIEAHLDISALDIDVRRLRIQEEIRIGQLEEPLRLISN